MKAAAVHGFAGGITMGVRRHFEVVGAWEPLNFGVGTVRDVLKMPCVVEPDFDKWQMPPGVKLVFGNPRCGGFSSLGSNTAGDDAHGHGCRQSIDALQVCRFGVANAVPVICFESVQQILAPKNRLFVDKLVKDLFAPAGYRVAHVLMCAAGLGNSQFRKRYFFVAYRRPLIFCADPPVPPEVAVTVRDVIGGLAGRRTRAARYNCKGCEYTADTYCEMSPPELPEIIPYLEPGDSLNNLHHRHGPGWFARRGFSWAAGISSRARSELPFGVSNNSIIRLKYDAPCPSIVGNAFAWIHPELDRPLTILEMARLMGWPAPLIPAGDYPVAQIAKGIVPAAGQWIARAAWKCLAGEWTEDRECTTHPRTKEVMWKSSRGQLEKTLNFTQLVPPKGCNIFNSLKGEPRYAS